MRASLWILVVALAGCSTKEPAAAVPADAGADCFRTFYGDCCEGEVRSERRDVAGVACTRVQTCSSGRWWNDDSDCESIRCPDTEPVEGASCRSGLKCGYACPGGNREAHCQGGVWALSACVVPKPAPAVGSACKAQADCAEGLFVGTCATWLPSPFCYADLCSGITDESCGPSSICLGPGCWPACTIDAAKGATGCGVGNRCLAVRVSSSTEAVGTCLGGCRSDADCEAGLPSATRRCRPEWGECRPTVAAPTTPHGAACTNDDACPCYRGAASDGYCAYACVVGGAACPAASVCDPLLPGPDEPNAWSSAPAGLGGVCAKICTTDDDCAPFGAKCRLGGGMIEKTCRF
jgi:hypothetical protein